VWQLLILPGSLSLYRTLYVPVQSSVLINTRGFWRLLDEQNRGWEENVYNFNRHGMLSEQLLSTFSSLYYDIQKVYNYGLWKREVQEGLLVFGVYSFLPFSQEISAELLTSL
jgi:hypothetical protein